MSSLARFRPDRDDALALLAGVAAVSGSYAVAGPRPSFVASPVERAVSRMVPGEALALAIATLGDLAQQLNYVMAVVLVVAAVAVAARVALYARAVTGNRAAPPVLTGALTWTLAVAASGAPLVAVGAAAPAALVVLGGAVSPGLASRLGGPAPLSSKRRRAVTTLGAAVGIAGAGYLAGERAAPDATAEEAPDVRGPNVDSETAEAALADVEAQSIDEPELPPLVSDRFYEVDINAVDPDLTAEEWSLSVTGAVDEAFTLDYEGVLDLPAEQRFVTLRCVSDPLDGSKMDTALWTGTSVDHLLERAGPDSDCGCVRLHAADGYFQVFPIEALRDSLLAYGMNGKLLPRGHGFPLRTLVPGHWGEINVKWLTEIEFLNEDADGYWEQRGWQGTGEVVPIAKIETAVDRDGGRRLVGGRAYGGTRGVSAVEVSVDGGDTWREARLSESLSEVHDDVRADDAWRQWALEYDPPEGSHTVVARMIDGNGDVQPRERREPRPRGASGWVRREF
ncbi:molybdopterin-dependent oxidoreductase [Halomicrobium salinisoli]|uniref:molybdopterin-dependent oxidoreductase n=1 Tax=Halomicrobium salinisoli TaxID=2878391 RepID=UPI001CEFB26C|nr:molybdopterin-dependent oxidoreductase [Halomicrobium salinisoli]